MHCATFEFARKDECLCVFGGRLFVLMVSIAIPLVILRLFGCGLLLLFGDELAEVF